MTLEIKVYAGCHRRVQCPLRVPCLEASTPAALACQGNAVHCQRDGDDLVFIPMPMGPHAVSRYTPTSELPRTSVRLEDTGDHVRVTIDGEELTSYWYANMPARPYFWPLYADGGSAITRAYPMMPDVAGETRDHPHHRSLWFAFGSVNGVDNWSEERGHGNTIHRSIDEIVEGPVFGRLATTSDWTDAKGARILTQKLTATFWHIGGGFRMIDFDVHLIATDGDVLFGDTKEGGLISVRVASSMDACQGGRIENSYGAVGEVEAWGRAAQWCDYSGMVGSDHLGIAIMNHQDSFRYPSYWHVRDYGLFAANPFALSEFTQGAKNGTHTMKSDESIHFLYRVMLHHGSASDANVRGHFLNYVTPPKVEVQSR